MYSEYLNTHSNHRLMNGQYPQFLKQELDSIDLKCGCRSNNHPLPWKVLLNSKVKIGLQIDNPKATSFLKTPLMQKLVAPSNSKPHNNQVIK
jgi:hypothetical protein